MANICKDTARLPLSTCVVLSSVDQLTTVSPSLTARRDGQAISNGPFYSRRIQPLPERATDWKVNPGQIERPFIHSFITV